MDEQTKNTFDLQLAEQEVTFTTASGIRHLVLRELDGKELEEYLEENKDRMDVEIKDGKAVVKGMRTYKGTFSSLLKRCLYENGKLVSLEEINKFPGRVQQGLHKIAQKLSALDSDSAAEVGN